MWTCDFCHKIEEEEGRKIAKTYCEEDVDNY